MEIAANDGYQLHYVKAHGIPCTGVEPTASTPAAVQARGIPVVEDFFGTRLAQMLAAQNLQADLMVANKVLAHVPDINDFAAGGLAVLDVEELPTPGGSLRVYAQRPDTGRQARGSRVDDQRRHEEQVGMCSSTYYAGFQANADRIKNDWLAFLPDANNNVRKVVIVFCAAAKGNTLLNYAGVRPDLLTFVVNGNPAKQGKYLPGSRIPITGDAHLKNTWPDYVCMLPWNLKQEIKQQLAYIRDWGGQLLTAIPGLEVL